MNVNESPVRAEISVFRNVLFAACVKLGYIKVEFLLVSLR